MRHYFIRIAFAAGTAIALTVPAFAQTPQQTPGSNITVSTCSTHMHNAGYTGHPWIDPYGISHPAHPFPYVDGFLDIAYTNDKSVAAKEIDFGLVARGSMVALAKDVGTFTSGTKIEHEFSLDPQVFPIGTALPSCVVLAVKYADGTQWLNPAPPPL